MRVDKIELIGFKSFADKTSFVLHPGITGIVGPNGCGKSNIVDAFRWVLGEQSAKTLRGDKMEEVIFNGSANKKPKGMAEVTMVVSGINGSVGGNGQGQNDVVMASRRLYRSGESEYMINRNPCRLKDIKDVFLDTGLDFKSYSILEQGRIGEILNAKPHDRRFIIEEVAGVMKYKARRAEALSKLESSRLNLVRINDIITELKKQINILDRLAKKAERYKKLSEEMHEIELRIARREYHQIAGSYGQALEDLRRLREQEAALKAEITGIENRTETRRVQLLEKEKALETIQKDFQAIEHEIADTESAVAVCANDIRHFLEYKNNILRQEEEVKARSSVIKARCEELRENIKHISEEMRSNEEALSVKTEILNSIEETLGQKEEQIEDKRREIFRIADELSSLRNELSKQQTSLETFEHREQSVIRESEEARRALAEIESSIGAFESEIQGRNNEILMLNEKKDVLTRELSEGRTSLEKLSAALSGAREDVASYQSRLNSLKELSVDTPARELLASEQSVRMLASLSEVLEVEPEYERAIEAALSEKADSFILDSFEDIERAVLFLRGKDIGRTSFVASSGLRSYPGRSALEGVIGSALDFVRIKDGFQEIAGNLLGNVLIVRDIRTAHTLRGTEDGFLFVTPGGEAVEPSGAVIVGEGRGIFRHKREMRELGEMIEEKKTVIDRINTEILERQKSIAGKEEEIRNVESSIYDIEKEISLTKLTIDNHIDDKERISRKLSYLTIEAEEISREKESLKEVISNTDKQCALAGSKKESLENEALALQEDIAQRKADLERFRAEVTDLRLLTTSNRERLDAVQNELESSEKTLDDLEQKKNALAAEQISVHEKIARHKSDIAEHEEKLKGLVSNADAIRADISGRKEEIETENELLMEVEHGLRDLRKKATEVSARVSELDIMRAELKLRLGNLAENVRNNYGAEIESIELAEVTPEDEERLSALKKKIGEIGAVNLGSLEEYEELQTRYGFMTQQQDDLNKSIAELEEAISKINSTTRKLLREAFEALRVKFSEVFVTLFGGGKAELVLTDEKNILETGIDIIAQPPGKKLQNINLLSGGEKALTALSLQFSSFLIKPTPLCILDEVDAPLDESNTERFKEMVNELSKETQFIVVTHNKTTMNIARHLYGITMEEAGVSKVISMQLAEA